MRLGAWLLVLCACVCLSRCEDDNALEGADGDLDCQCVPYFLCDPNNRIIDNGDGLIDIRSSIPTCAGDIEVCCKVPNAEPSPSPEPQPQPQPEPQPQPQPQPQPDPQPYPQPDPQPYPQPDPQPYPQPDPQPYPQPQPQPNPNPHNVPNVPDGNQVIVPMRGCGVRRLQATTLRILGGGEADDTATYFAEFPWMLAVLLEEPSQQGRPPLNRFKCGASLIHPRVALTAAHCISGQDLTTLKVRAGEWDTQNRSEPLPHQDRGVVSVVVHPDFKPGPLYNDVALVVMDRAFDQADNVDVVCLPDQGQVYENLRCYATGWGRDSFGSVGAYQKILRKVDLPLVPRPECQNRLRQTRLGPFFRLHSSFVCAGGEPGRDTCKGDGGGPMVCPVTQEPGRFVQVGIVAWGIGCGEAANPAVYANVANFGNWIRAEVQQITGQSL